jgi:hypothetical protein
MDKAAPLGNRPTTLEYSAGIARPDDGELFKARARPSEHWLVRFWGVENFMRLIGGEERYETLKRTYPSEIPWWELPCGSP